MPLLLPGYSLCRLPAAVSSTKWHQGTPSMRANTPRRPLAGLSVEQENRRPFFLAHTSICTFLSHKHVIQGADIGKKIDHSH